MHGVDACQPADNGKECVGMCGHELFWHNITHVKVMHDEKQDRDGDKAAPYRKRTRVFHGLGQVPVQQVICAGNNQGEEKKLLRKAGAGYGSRTGRDIPGNVQKACKESGYIHKILIQEQGIDSDLKICLYHPSADQDMGHHDHAVPWKTDPFRGLLQCSAGEHAHKKKVSQENTCNFSRRISPFFAECKEEGKDDI